MSAVVVVVVAAAAAAAFANANNPHKNPTIAAFKKVIQYNVTSRVFRR